MFDAMAATGVRALRCFTEVPGIYTVCANDIDAAAVAEIRRTAESLGLDSRRVATTHGDAADALYAARNGGLGRYDVVDLDPYGSAAPLLDAALQAVRDGGLLCVTGTDMAILCGSQPDAAFARYGSVPVRVGGHHHEVSLRMLLHALSVAAAPHGRCIEPLLSVSIDHYIRVFVRVRRSAAIAATAAERSALLLQSRSCVGFRLQPLVSRTGPNSFRPPLLAGRSRGSAPSIVVGSADSGSGDGSSGSGNGFGDSGNGSDSSGGNGSGESNWGSWRCPATGGPVIIGGPIWAGPIHNSTWVRRAAAMVAD
ncbi:unnamed protein product, partial [Phaeothamnion confervicola]